MSEPPITLRAIHDNGPLPMPIYRIVIHATAPGTGFPKASEPGSALGTAKYFQQSASGGSAHYVEDPTTETHCVPDNIEAWHAPPNSHSLGIEICGEATYTRAQWLSPQVWPAVQRAAARARELSDRFNVPRIKIDSAALLAGTHGICGHVDVSQAWHETDHTDPGPEFPWVEFMNEVNNPTGGEDMANVPQEQWDDLYRRVQAESNFVEWWDIPDDDPATPLDERQPNSKGELTKRIRETHNLMVQLAARQPVDPAALANALVPLLAKVLPSQPVINQQELEAALKNVLGSLA